MTIQEPKVCILKDADKNFSTSFIDVSKFNNNYHKYVSGIHNAYFVIPVSNISNIFMVFDRKSMPIAFKPIKVDYTIEILRVDEFASLDYTKPIFTKTLTVDINEPHDIFTFLHSLNELTLFNTLCNDPRAPISGMSDMFVFSISYCKIYDNSKIYVKREICGIPDLIALLQTQYMMGLNITFPFKLAINEDGSCGYSDPSQINAKNAADIIGNTKFSGKSVFNVTFPNMEIPIHTFISNDDYKSLVNIDYYDQFRSGSVTFFMGTAFDSNIMNAPNGNIFISDENFSMRKTSTIEIRKMIDFVMYTKIAPCMIRTMDMLITMMDSSDEDLRDELYTFDGVCPAFNYQFVLEELEHLTLPSKYKPSKYSRNYIISDSSNDSEIHGVVRDCNVAVNNITKQIENMDVYADFMKDVSDFVFPF